MPTDIRIINDTIIPDSFARGLTPRETQTRIAFFILGFGGPLVGALFALFTTKRWWSYESLWSFPRLVSAFAAIVFLNPGRATRSTFVLHGRDQYDVCIEDDKGQPSRTEFILRSLLLDGTINQSLIAAMIFGLVDFTLAFSISDMGYVFVFASILGGMNDFLIPLLLIYGRQPLLAIGGFAHTAAAVSVFTAVVHDYGVVTFTLVSFFSLWLYIGFTIAGLRVSRTSDKDYPINPMKKTVSREGLAALISVSLGSSTVLLVPFVYSESGFE
ncbi:hypothetical protein K439DRAFT_1611228 [Ramaria rubella]|nr:hypothetical protein K439DRAFT_1611228 [Ramaria rubella]